MLYATKIYICTSIILGWDAPNFKLRIINKIIQSNGTNRFHLFFQNDIEVSFVLIIACYIFIIPFIRNRHKIIHVPGTIESLKTKAGWGEITENGAQK